jgi:hypothetical protein
VVGLGLALRLDHFQLIGFAFISLFVFKIAAFEFIYLFEQHLILHFQIFIFIHQYSFNFFVPAIAFFIDKRVIVVEVEAASSSFIPLIRYFLASRRVFNSLLFVCSITATFYLIFHFLFLTLSLLFTN